MAIQIIKSSKNKKMLLVNEYLYHFDRETKKGNTWRCVSRTCAGRLLTDINNTIVINETIHDHTPDMDRVNKNKIIMAKNEAIEKNIPCNTFFTDITVQTRREGTIIPNINNLRDVYTRALKKNVTPFCSNSDILEIYKSTLNNDNFLQFDSGVSDINRILVYSTSTNIENLSMSSCWLSDGTFYSSPETFYQIYIVYGYYFNKVMPLVYFFCKNKAKQTYIQISNYLKENCKNAPKYWITDFEEGPISAFQCNYSNVEFSGCNFHFNQIIIKYLQTNKMITIYRNNCIFRLFVNKLMSLAFCPEEHIVSAFNTLISTDNNEKQLLEWFLRNFLNNSASVKQLSFWSVYKRVLCDIPSTTNACEGNNRHLNSYILSKNQHIGVIINAIKKEENRIACMIDNLKSGRIKASGYNSSRVKTIAMNFANYTLADYLLYIAETVKVKLN